MDLLPTDEQSEIVATVRSQLESDFSLNDLAARDGEASIIDPGLWARCAELGWFALGLAESDGGIGYGLVEEALLFGELGAHCTPGPFLATVLAAHVAAASGSAELVEKVISGEVRVALVEPDGGGQGSPSLTPGAVHGTFRATDYGDAQLGLALSGDQAAVVSLEDAAANPVASLDPLVPLATVELDTAPLAFSDDPATGLRDDPHRGPARRNREGHRRAVDRVRQGPRAVRPTRWIIPGGQAPLCRHGRARGCR